MYAAIISWIVIGLAVGFLVYIAKRGVGYVVGYFIAGMIGAIIGGFLMSLFSLNESASFIAAFGGAYLLIMILRAIGNSARRSTYNSPTYPKSKSNTVPRARNRTQPSLSEESFYFPPPVQQPRSRYASKETLDPSVEPLPQSGRYYTSRRPVEQSESIQQPRPIYGPQPVEQSKPRYAPPTLSLFISHSSKDDEFGFRLVKDLRRELGSDEAVWYDSEGGLYGGESWWSKIVSVLDTCDVFVIIISPNSMNSKWVMRELDIATGEGKRIIPVLYRQCDVRADLRAIQYISFLDSVPYNVAFDKLMQALKH